MSEAVISGLAKMQYYDLPHGKVTTARILKVDDTYKLNYV